MKSTHKRKAGLGGEPAAGSAVAGGCFDEDAARTHGADADEAGDNDSEVDSDAADTAPEGVRTMIKTPLQLLKWTHTLICRVHKVDK